MRKKKNLKERQTACFLSDLSAVEVVLLYLFQFFEFSIWEREGKEAGVEKEFFLLSRLLVF